jgi:hypothetical protein
MKKAESIAKGKGLSKAEIKKAVDEAGKKAALKAGVNWPLPHE